jgi:hypothetical protein
MYATVYNRHGGVVVGDVVEFDMASSDAATTTIENAGGTGIFENVIAPTAVGVTGFPVAIVTDLLGGAGAADTKIKVCLQGIVSATIVGTTPVAGDLLNVVAAQDELDCDSVVNSRAVGVLLENTTATTQGQVYFDGINGVGVGAVA